MREDFCIEPLPGETLGQRDQRLVDEMNAAGTKYVAVSQSYNSPSDLDDPSVIVIGPTAAVK